ncbi:MAG TPA: YtxH domain-containing protein [Anaerolineales bacterium]|nr:YtxH domain-containing protein [Anaerolineales bacterium]
MKSVNQGYEYPQMEPVSDGAKHVLMGIIIGGLVGATAMMLFAPRSGEELRAEIRDKAADLRDRTTDTVKDTVSQVVSKAGHLKGDVKGKTEDLKGLGQDMLVEQLDRATEALKAAKKAIQEF